MPMNERRRRPFPWHHFPPEPPKALLIEKAKDIRPYNWPNETRFAAYFPDHGYRWGNDEMIWTLTIDCAVPDLPGQGLVTLNAEYTGDTPPEYLFARRSLMYSPPMWVFVGASPPGQNMQDQQVAVFSKRNQFVTGSGLNYGKVIYGFHSWHQAPSFGGVKYGPPIIDEPADHGLTPIQWRERVEYEKKFKSTKERAQVQAFMGMFFALHSFLARVERREREAWWKTHGQTVSGVLGALGLFWARSRQREKERKRALAARHRRTLRILSDLGDQLRLSWYTVLVWFGGIGEAIALGIESDPLRTSMKRFSALDLEEREWKPTEEDDATQRRFAALDLD